MNWVLFAIILNTAPINTGMVYENSSDCWEMAETLFRSWDLSVNESGGVPPALYSCVAMSK